MKLVRSGIEGVLVLQKMLTKRPDKLVALHGQVGMMSDWDSFIKAMSSHGIGTEAVDLWSYLEDGEVSMEKFGEELNADHDDGGVLLGYSMGGRLALHALLDQPRKWKAAVVISSHTGLSLEDRSLRRSVDDEWGGNVENLPWLEFLNLWNKQGVLGDDVMPDRGSFAYRKAEIARSFNCWSLAEQEDLLAKLSVIEIPVLWVVGEGDEKFCNIGKLATSSLSNSNLLVVPNAGHRVPWEVEGDLVVAISQWISDEL